MIAGVVTPVLIMSGPGTGNMNLDMPTRSYMLSASLISSGILSLIQITRFRLFNTKYYLGTGLLSVVGTSFNFVPTFGVSHSLHSRSITKQTRENQGDRMSISDRQ